MQSLFLIILLSCASLALASVVRPHFLISAMRQSRASGKRNAFERDSALLDNALTLQERIAAHGCAADVCYALDGSANFGALGFSRAREFTQVVGIISATDRRVRQSALEFGTSNELVTELTSDRTAFLNALAQTRFSSARRSFSAAGVLGCSRMLMPRGRRGRNRPVIVVIGSGEASTNSRSRRIAEEFLQSRSDAAILNVAVGRSERSSSARSRAASFTSPSARTSSAVDLPGPAMLSKAVGSTVEFICKLPRA